MFFTIQTRRVLRQAGGTHYARTAGVKWILPLILQVSWAGFLKVTQQSGGPSLGMGPRCCWNPATSSPKILIRNFPQLLGDTV